MEIYKKLQEARKKVREMGEKKEGENTYSHYAYFTPEQVEKVVSKATEETGLICLTSLKKDQFGYFQELQLVDLDSPMSSLIFELRTERPEIKATNETQQMGGMDTYSERYIKMKVFQIKDNNLDFDSQDNRIKPKRDYTDKKSLTPDQFGYKDPKHKDVAKDSAEHDTIDL